LITSYYPVRVTILSLTRELFEDGISLLVKDIEEFEKGIVYGQIGSADLMAVKLGRVG
jgi:hypothetical protein